MPKNLWFVFVVCLFMPTFAGAVEYSEEPGKYLYFDPGSGDVTRHVTCPAGYYCPGFENETFNYENMGVYSCRDYDSGYPYSDAGSESYDQCFFTTTEQCQDFNTLPTGPNPTYRNTTAVVRHYVSGGDGLATLGACRVTSIDCNFWEGPGGVPRANGPMNDYVLESVAWNNSSHIKWKRIDGTYNSADAGQGDAGELQEGEWRVEWPDGAAVRGWGTCVGNPGNDGDVIPPNDLNFPVMEGPNCWCIMECYKLPGDPDFTCDESGQQWVWKFEDGEYCSSECVTECATILSWGDPMQRNNLFAAFGYQMNDCDASTINITYYNQSSVYDAASCNFGDAGAITLPSAPTRTGYTFNGWNIAN